MCCINCFSVTVLFALSSYSRTPLHSCDRWRLNFTLLAANFTAAMEGSTTSATPKKDPTSQESLIGANWPSLPVPAETQETIDSQDSPI